MNLSPYSYNTSNQLTSTPAASFTFDNNGNTLAKADTDGTTNYAWDIENRLTGVTLPNGGGVVTFKYDPFGRRIQKATSSGTTNYVYDGANVVDEYNAAGALVTKYSQGQGIDEPLGMWRNNATTYYHADGLGSITSLTDSAGTAQGYYSYDSFGKIVGSPSNVTNPYRYTGREWDSETNLYYYRARYYDPSVGRFISEDPLTFGGGDLNFYAYVLNSPTELIDPEGLQHTPGGPPHLPPGVKFRCRQGLNRTQGDSCEDIQRKLVIISTLLAGHALWDMQHGGNQHSADIDSLWGAFKNCLREFNKWCVNCPKQDQPKETPQPKSEPKTPLIPIIPRIPGPFPVIIDPCVLQPWQPWCGGGRVPA